MGSAAEQGPLWGAAARDWADVAEPEQVPFYDAAFEALGIREGTELLDVGCGAGLALQLAAKRGARTSGLDASTQLLAIARERVPDADLREGDAEELPFGQRSFDAVTAFNSVQYAASPAVALTEIKRVARDGAPIILATWGTAEQCEMRIVLGAIGSLLPPPPPGSGGPFALAAPGALESLVAAGGFNDPYTIDVATPFVYRDLDTAVRGQLSSGPARRAIEHVGRAAAATALVEALRPITRSDGSIRLDNVFKLVVAHA